MAQVIVRLETSEGMKGYIIDGDAWGKMVEAFYKDNIDQLHPMLQPLVKGMMFALRHGPIQKILRDLHMPELCKECKDKDAQAFGALARVLSQSAANAQQELMEPGGRIPPMDIMQKDLYEASTGMIVRLPEYDGPVPQQLGEPNETAVLESSEGEYRNDDGSSTTPALGSGDGRFDWPVGDATYRQDEVGSGTL